MGKLPCDVIDTALGVLLFGEHERTISNANGGRFEKENNNIITILNHSLNKFLACSTVQI